MASNPSDVSNARGQSESTDEDQKTPSICRRVSTVWNPMIRSGFASAQ